ncbi:hypothetical protein [Chryseolinea soli]|nr:hypothetical protein [Chryseolinea soli]
MISLTIRSLDSTGLLNGFPLITTRYKSSLREAHPSVDHKRQ